MIRPKSPRTELKISMTRILTNLYSKVSIRKTWIRGGNSNVQAGVSSISKRSTATVDTDRNTTDQVAHADQETGPEQSETSVVVAARSCGIRADDTVNGDDFAENDGDQVLCSDSGSLDTTTEDRGTGDEDTPVDVCLSISDLSCIVSFRNAQCTDHAAPTTERPIQRAIPVLAHA
jgi:hypothetical protein